MVIAIITICATLSVVAGLEFGIKTVSYAAFMCGNLLMMVVFALDEPWYILNVIVQTVGYHLSLGGPLGSTLPLYYGLPPVPPPKAER